VILIIILIAVLVVVLHPLAWLLANSVKTNQDAQSLPPRWVAKELTLRPFADILTNRNVYATNWARYFLNTIIVTVSTTVLVVVFSILVGYGLAKFDIRGKTFVLVTFLLIQFLNGAAVMIPEYIFISRIGLYNTHTGLIFVYLLFQVPFATWLFYSFFQTLPKDLEEAAAVEGATVVGILVRITIPLSQVGIVTVSIMSFILTWSEYPFANILLESEQKVTVSIGLANFISAINIYWNQMAAASLIVGLPMLIILMTSQKYFIRGLTAGAIKG
jgi:ABC-type glycerol-3-phosphate transport system permease component